MRLSQNPVSKLPKFWIPEKKTSPPFFFEKSPLVQETDVTACNKALLKRMLTHTMRCADLSFLHLQIVDAFLMTRVAREFSFSKLALV